MPRPTFNLAATPHAADDDAWAAWQARLDATADERRMDPAVEAQVLANAAVLRRFRAAMGEK